MIKGREKRKRLFAVGVIFVTVMVFGYFLFKTSPQNIDRAASVADHHGGATVPVDSERIESLIGQSMPEMRLESRDGSIRTIEDFKGKITVLFFNEGLMCYPACWNQIAAFGSDERFNSNRVQAISVVIDSPDEWQRAMEKMPELAGAKTMFDAGAELSRELGVLTLPSSMHRGEYPGHTYLILDEGGVLRYAFDDPYMGVANDALFEIIEEME